MSIKLTRRRRGPIIIFTRPSNRLVYGSKLKPVKLKIQTQKIYSKPLSTTSGVGLSVRRRVTQQPVASVSFGTLVAPSRKKTIGREIDSE